MSVDASPMRVPTKNSPAIARAATRAPAIQSSILWLAGIGPRGALGAFGCGFGFGFAFGAAAMAAGRTARAAGGTRARPAASSYG
jgi:hypothetical protein